MAAYLVVDVGWRCMFIPGNLGRLGTEAMEFTCMPVKRKTS